MESQDIGRGWELDPQIQLVELDWVKSQIWPSCTLTDNWIIRSRKDSDHDGKHLPHVDPPLKMGDCEDSLRELMPANAGESFDREVG